MVLTRRGGCGASISKAKSEMKGLMSAGSATYIAELRKDMIFELFKRMQKDEV